MKARLCQRNYPTPDSSTLSGLGKLTDERLDGFPAVLSSIYKIYPGIRLILGIVVGIVLIIGGACCYFKGKELRNRYTDKMGRDWEEFEPKMSFD